MPAIPPGLLPLLFAALALLFAGLAWRAQTADYGRRPAARAHIRIAVIFAVVSAGLLLLRSL